MKFITSSMKAITPEMLSKNIVGANLNSKPHQKREENYLYVDLGKYAKQAWETLLQSKKAKDVTEKELILFNGFNQTMHTMLDENGYYLFYFDVTPGNNQVKYDEYCDFRDLWDIETIISLIFQVNDRRKNVLWSEKTSLECNKSAVAFYLLWLQLEKEVESAQHRLKLVEHYPSTPIPSIEDILDDYKEEKGEDSFPSFNLDIPDNVEFCYTHETMINGNYFGEDVSEEAWKYVVTGKGKAPTEKLNWTGKLNELAKMAELFNNEKKVEGGYLALAAKIFKVKGKDTDRKRLANTSKLSSKDEKKLIRALQNLIGRHNQL